MSDFENISEFEENEQNVGSSLEGIESRIMELRQIEELTSEEEAEIALLRERYDQLLLDNLNKPEP